MASQDESEHRLVWTFVVAMIWSSVWLILQMLYYDLTLVWPWSSVSSLLLALPIWLVVAYGFSRIARRIGAHSVAWVGVSAWSIAVPLVLMLGAVNFSERVDVSGLPLFIAPFAAAIVGSVFASVRPLAGAGDIPGTPAQPPTRGLIIVSIFASLSWLVSAGLMLYPT